jgi:hypothetical protein
MNQPGSFSGNQYDPLILSSFAVLRRLRMTGVLPLGMIRRHDYG